MSCVVGLPGMLTPTPAGDKCWDVVRREVVVSVMAALWARAPAATAALAELPVTAVVLVEAGAPLGVMPAAAVVGLWRCGIYHAPHHLAAMLPASVCPALGILAEVGGCGTPVALAAEGCAGAAVLGVAAGVGAASSLCEPCRAGSVLPSSAIRNEPSKPQKKKSHFRGRRLLRGEQSIRGGLQEAVHASARTSIRVTHLTLRAPMSRHDDPQRPPMDRRERLAVHLGGEHHLGRQRLGQGDRRAVVLGGLASGE